MSHDHDIPPLTTAEEAVALEETRRLIAMVQALVRQMPERIRNKVVMDLGYSITCAAILAAPCRAGATHGNLTGLVQHAIDHGFVASPDRPKIATIEVSVRPAQDLRGVAAEVRRGKMH